MDVQRRVLKDGTVRWKVRWRQADRYRAQTFDRKADATNFAAELRRRQALGTLGLVDSGRETLDEYIRGTWAPTYLATLARKTQLHYEQLILKHVLPYLGAIELRQITPDTIARWQAERLGSGAGSRFSPAGVHSAWLNSSASFRGRDAPEQPCTCSAKDPPTAPSGSAAAESSGD